MRQNHAPFFLTHALVRLGLMLAVNTLMPAPARAACDEQVSISLPTQWVPAAERNRGPRLPNVLVLHYTVSSLERAFEHYQQGHVSAHYTVDRTGDVYHHVDEREVAHHAGLSYWRRASLNRDSIGIEIVNVGPIGPCSDALDFAGLTVCRGELAWEIFSEPQVQSLIAVAQDILARHPIDPFDVIGHADVAPLRKEDPGPAFPWLRLAQSGIGVAYDPNQGALVHGDTSYPLRAVLDPNLRWAQEQLAAVGYAVPQHGALDAATSRVVLAFNSHYLGRFDAELDDESVSVLDALVQWRQQRMTAVLLEERSQKAARDADQLLDNRRQGR